MVNISVTCESQVPWGFPGTTLFYLLGLGSIQVYSEMMSFLDASLCHACYKWQKQQAVVAHPDGSWRAHL